MDSVPAPARPSRRHRALTPASVFAAAMLACAAPAVAAPPAEAPPVAPAGSGAYSGPDVAVSMPEMAVEGIYPGQSFKDAEKALTDACESCLVTQDATGQSYLATHNLKGRPEHKRRRRTMIAPQDIDKELIRVAALKSSGKIYRVVYQIQASEALVRATVDQFIKREKLPWQHTSFNDQYGSPVQQWQVGNKAAAVEKYEDGKGRMVKVEMWTRNNPYGVRWVGIVELLDTDVYNGR